MGASLCAPRDLANTWQTVRHFRAFAFATVRDTLNREFERFFPRKVISQRVPMMGFEPIPRFSQERILSPLRLPFRHIGGFNG